MTIMGHLPVIVGYNVTVVRVESSTLKAFRTPNTNSDHREQPFRKGNKNNKKSTTWYQVRWNCCLVFQMNVISSLPPGVSHTEYAVPLGSTTVHSSYYHEFRVPGIEMYVSYLYCLAWCQASLKHPVGWYEILVELLCRVVLQYWSTIVLVL